MPRERSTWNRTDIARQAGLKVADPYLMNQNHVQQQPAADQYVIGDPSDFAEDVTRPNTWEAEYSGGQVRRDEIGMPQLRPETFNHPEKTASEAVLTKKAALCVAIARATLPKTASTLDIEEQSYDLMHLPDENVMSMYSRLAQTQEQAQGQQPVQAAQKSSQDQVQQDQVQQDQGQQIQQKQGGEVPPQFKEQIEKKKEEAEGQQQQDKQAGQEQIAQLQQQAQQLQDQIAQMVQEAQAQQQAQAQQAQAQDQEAQTQQQAQQLQQQIAQLQQELAQLQQQAPGQQPVQASQKQAQGQEQQGQMQQQSQAQQVAQAVQQALQQGQDPVQAAEQCMAQMQQAQAQQAQQQVQQDSQIIDTMLAQDPIQEPVAAMDIQIDTPTMDVGEVQLGPEDDMLRQLFANDEVQQAQQAQDQQEGKQAHVVRTASMRTVGTRPSAGVSQIGGQPSGAAGGPANLSSLWNSAPDVREAFGIPTNQ
jgi:hypothetical protein